MTSFKNIYFLFSFLVLTACVTTPTEYGPLLEQHNGGYIDREIENNRYEIQVRGNAHTDHATLENHFHRRAEEICGHKNYQSNLKKEYNTTVRDAIFTGYAFVPASRSNLRHVSGEITCQ